MKARRRNLDNPQIPYGREAGKSNIEAKTKTEVIADIPQAIKERRA
jgi:hypothetical protein